MAIFDSFMIGATPKSSHYDVVTTVEIKMAATSMDIILQKNGI